MRLISQCPMPFAAAALSLTLACAAAALPARADLPETILHTFSGASDGTGAAAELTEGPDGAYYGTTSEGGKYNGGTLYKITADGKLTVLHDFGGGSGGNADGKYVYSPVTFGPDGTIYGTTYAGGYYELGTVYAISTKGYESILHHFAGGADGARPQAGLTFDPSTQALYGTTYGGAVSGPSAAAGTIFQVSIGSEGYYPDRYSVLYLFTSPSDETDGSEPIGTLSLSSIPGEYGVYPVLYGTTQVRGAGNFGTVYEFSPNYYGGALSVLHAFGDGSVPNDGMNPGVGPLQIAADGSVYGVTYTSTGTTGGGTVFKIAPDFTETILHTFDNADGSNPEGGVLLAADGNLYGTASAGGPENVGVLYSVPADGGILSDLYNFGTSSADGETPESRPLVDDDGDLIGTTAYGGPHAAGTVYKLTGAGIPLPAATVDLEPATTTGGSEQLMGTVTLDAPAPAGGALVSLESSDRDVLSFTRSLTIPAGSETASFDATTTRVTTPTNVTVTASYGGQSQIETVTVTPQPATPQLAALVLQPTTLFGAIGSSFDTVYLTGKATVDPRKVTADDDIKITSSNPLVANPQTDVYVSLGYTRGFLHIKTTQVTEPTTVTITATYNGVSLSKDLTVLPTPVTLQSVTIPTYDVKGGATTTDSRVHLSNKAAADTLVVLTSSNPAVASVPAQELVHRGFTSHVFAITTKPVTQNQTVTITAASGGVSQFQTVTVTP